VLGVFWPEKSQDNARGSLNQALHYLRRSLAPEAIRTTADTVEVDRDVVSCDAANLLDAFQEGRWSEGADLYGGELLPGYFDSGHSAEFEHWLDAARIRMRTAAVGCAWKIAEAEESAGNGTSAALWARRACKWSACEEVGVRRLMEMMARLGDRTGVLEAYDALARSLEVDETEPSPETKRLLQELRARWAEEDRVAASEGVSGLAAAEGVSGSASPRGPDGTLPRQPWGGAVERVPSLLQIRSALVSAGLMIVILSLWALTRAPAPGAPQWTTLVMEEMAAEDTEAPMARVLRAGMASQLLEMTALRVVADADRETVARERGFLVRGNLIRLGDEIRAGLQLVDAERETLLASTSLQERVAEFPAVLDEMARSMAQFVRREVGAALEQRRLVEAKAPEGAITMVQLGRQDMALGASLWKDRSAETAVAAYLKADSMLAEAARQAPDWDLPWIDRAETAYRLMWIERLGGGRLEQGGVDLVDQGIQFANEALARDHRQAGSLELRALLYEWRWLLSQPDPSGRSGELLAQAEADARRATELDPHRARAWTVLGAALLHRGAWADAYWALGRAVAADTHLKNDAEIVGRLFTAAWETGNVEAARSWCDLLAQRSGPGWPVASCRLHLMAVEASPDFQRLDEIRREAAAWPFWPRVRHQLDALSAVLYARGPEMSRALEILAGLPAGAPGSEVPYLRAWALVELGEVEAARASLEGHVAAAPSALSFLWKSRRFLILERSR